MNPFEKFGRPGRAYLFLLCWSASFFACSFAVLLLKVVHVMSYEEGQRLAFYGIVFSSMLALIVFIAVMFHILIRMLLSGPP